MAIANEDALQQVLDNLLSNAIRFSSSGSVVELIVGVEGGPFIEVHDEGVGLDAQARKNLFRKFGRGELRPPNGEWGSGLGLFIARKLTVASGGNIHHIEREKGTGFRVSLKAV
ncbi:sensor histidine kinase [Brucella pseudogrignonensis]|uniref:sensor histidine kinase n=1 Tax=Brucella pseudogrignonensis TaxID=419475 RepID=UPI0038B60D10